MNKEEFARFNLLSEKVVNGSASMEEFVEFHELLKAWNLAEDLSFLRKLGESSI